MPTFQEQALIFFDFLKIIQKKAPKIEINSQCELTHQ
jgi:hypothetical protein